MGNSHKGKARDLSTQHKADLDRVQPSLADILAQLDTTQGGAVEAETVQETRTHLKAVPDLKENEEKPETISIEDAVAHIATLEKGDMDKLDAVAKEYRELFTGEDLKRINDAINRQSQKIQKPVAKAKKQEVKESPAELLAQLVQVVEGIDNMNTLEDFSKECKRKGLLMGGVSEKSWWIKPLKDSENSQILVDAIMKKKNELIEKVRIAGQIRKIESIDDIEELRKHVRALKHFNYIKIGANGEPIADDKVPGSKEIVEALNQQRKKLLTEKRLTASIGDILKKFKNE